jgi:hypothetical protein
MLKGWDLPICIPKMKILRSGMSKMCFRVIQVTVTLKLGHGQNVLHMTHHLLLVNSYAKLL